MVLYSTCTRHRLAVPPTVFSTNHCGVAIFMRHPTPPVSFCPFAAIVMMGLLIRTTHTLPLTTADLPPQHDAGNLTAVTVENGPEPDNFTVTFVGERIVELENPAPPPPPTHHYSVRHLSTLETLFDTGSQILDPVIHFLQNLAEGVRGSPHSHPSAPPAMDKRMLYIA
jgi:hypothetical protein